MSVSTARRFLGALAMVLAAPAAALACPVCGTSGTDNNAWAYGAMTVVLSVLPLGMIGGVVYWVSRRAASADDNIDQPRG